MDNMKKINALLRELDGCEPLLDYKETAPEATHKMIEGMAKAFADKGFRDYLEHEYARLLKVSALQSSDLSVIIFNKGRISLLKELLAKGMNAFKSLQNL